MSDAKSDWICWSGYIPQGVGKTVIRESLNRIRHLYTLADDVVVSFSGGKDSTVALMLALSVAKELGRLPLRVAFLDDEIYDPDTIEYMESVYHHPDILMDWFCVQKRTSLRAKKRSFYFTWDRSIEHLWPRKMPSWAIKDEDLPPLREDATYKDVMYNHYIKVLGLEKIVLITGIRVEEALNRRRVIVQSGNYYAEKWKGYIYAKPIWDWRVRDVWKAIIENDWPHSAYYDKCWMAGIPLSQQRVAPWGNVASVRETRLYAEFYPDFWNKVINRLPELKAAARYGKTKLFQEVSAKPEELTWQEYTMRLVDNLDEESQKFWLKEISNYLIKWAKISSTPLPEEMSAGLHVSWRKLASMVSKNDYHAGVTRDRI